MELKIRSGTDDDAKQAINVIRRSIIELCEIDHQNDATKITEWILNKTEENWRRWVSSPRGAVFVAEREGQLVGVSMMDFEGTILLNYVHPDARYTGVSKALLATMEVDATNRGIGRCTLQSTETALVFYERCGYFPMKKSGSTEFILEKSLCGIPSENGKIGR
ncbi:GNAT family N-acetyltransferase [Acidithiobacillus thiooxidans]|nr:GNAT family N-acetyltransferase [Acidithiobacillus thiooxidans]